jgi:hypothetical protein
MTKIAVDLTLLSEAFRELSDQVCEIWEGDEEPSPPLVQKAMLQLLDILERQDIEPVTDKSLAADDIDELGEYGLTLIQEMSSYAADLGQQELSYHIEDLTFPFAVWLARRDCEIKNLAPVVNAFARSANDIKDNNLLKQLFTYINEIMDALSPNITQDLEKNNPMRPWRILIINRAIIATRSHDTELMEMAFKTLVEQLPEEAPGFFEEGVEQMHLIDYPEHVRKLMHHYYLMYGTPQTIH